MIFVAVTIAIAIALVIIIQNDAGETLKNPSVGLEYNYLSSPTEYYVVGIGSCRDRDIVIPAEYNGSMISCAINIANKSAETTASDVINKNPLNNNETRNLVDTFQLGSSECEQKNLSDDQNHKSDT